jgi:hypothetical protein
METEEGVRDALARARDVEWKVSFAEGRELLAQLRRHPVRE